MQNHNSLPFWICLLLTVVTVFLYSQVQHFDFINLDDPAYVTDNDYVKMGITEASLRWVLWGDVASNWHPLTMFSHMLDVTLYGVNPGAHHITNVQFHVLNTLIVFWIFFKLTRCPWKAFWIALFFSIHPLHVESVAWISERKDVLSTFFGLLCILCYIKFTHCENKLWYWFSIMALFLGLLSKPMLVTFPFILLLLDFWPLRRLLKDGRLIPLVVLEKLPFIILSITFSIITFFIQNITGAVLQSHTIPIWVRIVNAFRSYVVYMYQTFLPLNLSVFYPYPLQFNILKSIGYGLLILGITLLFWKYKNKFPWGFIGWFWFIGTLFPVIGIIQVGVQARADRYMYFPMLGILIIVIHTIFHIQQRFSFRRSYLTLLGISISLFYGFHGYKQISKWENSYSLFSQAVVNTGGSAIAYSSLGIHSVINGNIDIAEEMFLKALSYNPRDPLSHMNLVDIYRRKGDDIKRKFYYEKLMEINPTQYVHQLGIAGLMIDLKLWSEARERLRYYVRYNPFNADAIGLLGVVEAELGNISIGLDYLKHAEKLNPMHPAVHSNLGITYRAMGKIESARYHFEKALLYDPANHVFLDRFRSILRERKQIQDRIFILLSNRVESPCYDIEKQVEIALMLRSLENHDQAIQVLENANQCDSFKEPLLYHLGILYAEKAQYSKSIDSFNRLIKTNPDHVEGYYRIGTVLARMNQAQDACQAIKKALEKGFNDSKRLKNDPNLASIQEEPCFRELVNSIIR